MTHFTERYVRPLFSPYSLIQEELWAPTRDAEWLMLIVCMMLNCTKRKQVEKVLPSFTTLWPTPEKFLESSNDDVALVCKSLGFANRRTVMMKRMTKAFQNSNWQHANELPGIGEYAARSWEIFYKNVLGECEPKDHALVQYWRWRLNEKDRSAQSSETPKVNEV